MVFLSCPDLLGMCGLREASSVRWLVDVVSVAAS